ncbi:DNA repair protein rad18 [Batrachochytrium salamandrivorans]|nr:DNA repair protein rad18 [Batrachochytrium salamandrivorans]
MVSVTVLDDLVSQLKSIRKDYMQKLILITSDQFVQRDLSPTSNLPLSVNVKAPLSPSDPGQETSLSDTPSRSQKRRLNELESSRTHSAKSDHHDDEDDFEAVSTAHSSTLALRPTRSVSGRTTRSALRSLSDRTKMPLSAVSVVEGASVAQNTHSVLAASAGDDVPLNEYQPQGDSVVSCPICSKSLVARLLNSHLDYECGKSSRENSTGATIQRSSPKSSKSIVFSASQSSLSSPLSKTVGKGSISKPSGSAKLSCFFKESHIVVPDMPELQRTPKAYQPYSLLNDAKIKKMLKNDGLNTSGSRKRLVDRHTEWTTRYNANLDSRTPVSDDALRNSLVEWDRVKNQDDLQRHDTSFRGSSTHQTTPQSQLAVEAHLEKYQSKFDALVNEVRARKIERKSKELLLQEKGEEDGVSAMRDRSDVFIDGLEG